MKKQVRWTRWHRFDDAGNKYIKRFENHEDPSDIVDLGYTAWVRGTGPLNDEHYNNVVTAIRAVCQGVPKTDEHKEKMRQAKLGVPKSEEHKKNMSLAWERRRENGMGHNSEESKLKQSQTRKAANQNVYLKAMAQLEQMKRQGTM
jgi:hypothetical protein